MQMSKDDHFFYEWLIVGKGMSQETFSKLSNAEIEKLRVEWRTWYKTTK